MIGVAWESDQNPVYETGWVFRPDTGVDVFQDWELYREVQKLRERRGAYRIINVAVGLHMGWPKLDPQISGGTVAGDAWSVDPLTGRLKTTYALDLSGQDIANVRSVLSQNGTWSIDASGNLTAASVTAKKLCLEDVCIEREQLRTLLQNAGLLSATPPPPPPPPAAVTEAQPAGETALVPTSPEPSPTETTATSPTSDTAVPPPPPSPEPLPAT